MAEASLVDYFSIGASLGIIGTFLAQLYYSRKQMRGFSVDIETSILNNLNEKIHGMTETLVHKPELVKILDKNEKTPSDQLVFAYYILFMCAYAFHMRRRGVLSDNEWAGWLRWMTSAFEGGEIRDMWGKDIDPKKWFDPAFENFIDREIITKRGSI